MQVLVKLIGTGTEADPYRVDLPTWSLIALDYAAREALVEVPATDLPPGLQLRPVARPWLSPGQHQAAALPPAALQAWQDLIRDRYPQGFAAWQPARAV